MHIPLLPTLLSVAEYSTEGIDVVLMEASPYGPPRPKRTAHDATGT